MDTNTAIIRYQNWIDIFREWADSGMTKRDFCREKNIHEKTFFYYQRKVRSMAAESAGLPASVNGNRPEIVKISVRKMDPPTMIRLRVNGIDVSVPEDVPTTFLSKLLEAASHGAC